MGGDAVGSFFAFGDGELGSGVGHIDWTGDEARYVVAVGFDRAAVEADGDCFGSGDGGGHGGGVGSVPVIGPAAEVGIGRIADCGQFRGICVQDRVAVLID